MNSKHILAIDQGTSGTKAIIFDENAKIIAKGFTELDSIYPRPGFVEQDPEKIYENMISAVHKCVNTFQHNVRFELDSIQICGISNQRETFILWEKSGEPLHNAVVWQCKRSVDICGRIKQTKLADEITARTGLVVDPYFSGTKIKWLYDNIEGVRAAIDNGAAYFGTVDTWLLYKLTGGRSFYTDYTNASRTLLFNINRLQWDSVLLRRLGLKNLHVPEVKPSAFDFGETTFEETFPRPVKITGIIGDSHAAAFGESCFERGDAKVTLGTGSSILMNTGHKRVESKNGLVSTICWSLPDRIDYALEGIIVTAGATIKWMRDKLGLFSHVMESEAMATSVSDNGGVYFVPAFSGLGAPHWKMNSKAMISGITFASDINHIVRAALESIPYQIKDIITTMEADSKIKLKELNADGGITSNNFVMQFIADLLQTNVRNIGIEDVSALGAAYIAGLQSGIFASLQQLKEIVFPQRRFVPGDKQKIAQEYYKGWQNAVNIL
ncbi:glycerol kinase GlpK [candidate division KSB1 bacterium]|nr:glycerol kinase GlpK [candidate division KSB1 bacterium]RQW00828.1 MAG: glycerol kinase GlpK [candidate division KSB1 bacterium]